MRDGTRWSPPDEIAEYRVVRELGRGGMGHVYVGHDTLLDRAVAIKFMTSRDAGPVERERFFIEARAIARLQHPNVVGIYRVGEIAGQPYLVYELVRGRSLDQIAVPIDWTRALDIGIGLARGLAAAHRRSVLHRDIKAANAVLGDDDQVKLLDFGLAKLLDSAPRVDWLAVRRNAPAVVDLVDSSTSPPLADETLSQSHNPPPFTAELTAPGAQLGTPLYMAPEIWRGDPATMQSDVYAMGVLLHYLCAGQPPHRTADPKDLPVRVTTCDAAPVAQLVPEIDARLAAVIDRCLSRDPARRPGSGDELRDALEQLRAPPRAIPPQGNPYRGLMPFEAEHRALLFGRETDVRAVLDRLRTDPCVLIAGDSGVGKSSLCRAGVLPLIADGELDRTRRWTVIVVLPGARPIDVLASALAPALAVSQAELAAQLRGDPSHLHDVLRAQTRDRGLAILIDQLEEILTVADAAEARAFAAAIGELARCPPGVAVLATLRGDFLTRVADLPGLGDHVVRGFYLVRPLAHDGVVEAIVGPARAAGIAFESPAMVDELAASIVDGGLPLLQFALAELWQARDVAGHCIPRAALGRIGGVSGALARHADGVLAGLAPADRASARRLLLGLLTDENAPARRGADELAAIEPRAAGVLEALVRGRLVVARDVDGGAAYEIAHEALIRGWSTLRRWLDDDAGTRVLRERLRTATTEWERSGHAPEALWSERRLAALAGLDHGALGGVETRFVAASHRAVVRRRRARWLAAAIGGAIVAAVVVALAALNRSSQQQLVRLHEEQGRQALLSGDPMRGLPHLAEAYREGGRGAQLRFMIANALRDLGVLEASLVGHSDRVWSLDISPDGTRVVTGSEDATARLWSLDGRQERVLAGHDGRVLWARFSPDGTRIATASDGARLWDARSGIEMCRMNHPAVVHMLAFSPDGAQLATAAADGIARIWDTRSCGVLHELAPPAHKWRLDHAPATLLAYDASGTWIATWNDEGPAAIWDARTGELHRLLDGTRGFMYDIAFAPDGATVVAAFAAGTAALFDAETGRERLRLTGHRDVVAGARISADGAHVLTSSGDGTARVWNARTGAIELSLEHPGPVRSARWSLDGSSIATADAEGGVRIWDARTGRIERTMPGHVDEVWAVVFDARGGRLMTPSSDGTARIWSTRWTRHLRSFDVPLDPVRDFLYRGDTFGAISDDSTLVMTLGGQRPEVHLWDRATGGAIATVPGHTGGTEGGAFSPDGRFLATCGRDRTAKIWRVGTRGLEHTLDHDGLVGRVRYSSDGTKLVTASYDGTARVWGAAGALLATLRHPGAVLDARFSPDGARVVTAALDGVIRIWDASGGDARLVLRGHTDKVGAAMFSPGGREILSAGNDKSMRLWDARSGRLLVTLEGHKAEVMDAAFSPDGQLIASASADATLRVWGADGRALAAWSQASPLLSVHWSKDGQYLLTTALDGSNRLWSGALELPAPMELDARLRCRVPFHLANGRVVRDEHAVRCP